MSDVALAASTDESSTSLSGEISYSNNYTYPEFAGFAGERQLKSILRKILSAAHYRLWELLTDHQAQGNDCYLSKRSIASGLDRGDRAISLCLEQLQARHLLSLRAERKLLRQPNGSYKPHMVIVKDFSGLYDLAHEYYLWTKEDPAYIAPDRDFADFLCQDEELVKKLRRFYDYRRVICDKYPGPKPQKKCVSEEDCWFTDYTASEAKYDAEAVLEDESTRIRKFNSPFNAQSNVQNNSLERINNTDNFKEQIEGDSNDSGRDPEEGAAEDYTKNETPKPEQVPETLSPFTPPTKTTNPEPNVSETRGVDQSAEPDQQKTRKRKKYQGDGKPRPVANAPISAYVHEFSQVLGDGNMHASETYLLRQAEEYGLSHPLHALACLVRAHVAAMPLEARYRDPITDKPLKMVTVNYLFKQFAQSFSEWSHAYLSNGELTEDIKKDERLKLFVLEYRAQDPGEPPEPHMVQPQDPEELAEPQLVFEELRIPPPAQWMNEAKAETLVARIEGDRDRLEAEKITLEFALIHRCRSLVYRGTVFIVELQLTSVNGAGQQSRWPMHLADELQWQHYCEEQKILPRSDQP